MKEIRLTVSKAIIVYLSLLFIIYTSLSPIAKAQNSSIDAWQDCKRTCTPTKYDELFSKQDAAKILEKAKQISGILEELEAHRQNFLQSGNFNNLFPAVYYHTTKLEMNEIMSGKMDYPTQKMDMMMRFYDAYKANRKAFEAGGSSAVEPHWKGYYDEAQKANKFLGQTNLIAQAFILDGIKFCIDKAVEAHVDFDLPRAIRHITGGNQLLASQMQEDFQKTDSLFSRVTATANSDIVKALFPGSTFVNPLLDFGSKIPGKAPDVVEKRHDAWSIGISNGMLPTQNARQVVFDHSANSTKYLPQELKDRGLCGNLSHKRSFIIRDNHNSKIQVCKNDKVTMKASGRILFGPWSGTAGPDGFPYPQLTEYNFSDLGKYNHGALLVFIRVGNDLLFLGKGASWSSAVNYDGLLIFGINDRDYENNSGQFEGVLAMEGYRIFK